MLANTTRKLKQYCVHDHDRVFVKSNVQFSDILEFHLKAELDCKFWHCQDLQSISSSTDW
jgi:hypothetical protein